MTKPGDNEQPAPVQVKNLLQEWREDYRLATKRDRTGVEPQSEPTKCAPEPQQSTSRQKPKRVKLNGIDVPF